VFSELSRLIADGNVPPLLPSTLLGYEEIPKALQLLRDSSHIGKIVIFDDRGTKLAVPVSVRTWLELSQFLNFLDPTCAGSGTEYS
jgi:hypothetical protein